MKKLIIIVSIAVVLSGCTSTVNTDSNGGTNGNNSIPKAEQGFAEDFKPVSQYPISKDMVELLFLNSLSEEQVIVPSASTSLPEINEENAMEAAMAILGVKTDWPKDYLSPDMPAYTKGKINGWNTGGRGEYDIFILIDDTNREDLDEYIKLLKDNGFKENNRAYEKDAFTVKLQFNTDTVLQISSYRIEGMKWPEMLSFIPPLTKGYLVSIEEPAGDVSYGTLYFKGLTKTDIKEWEEKLIAAGVTVDSGEYLKENVEYNGKNCRFSAFFDSAAIDEWGLYFSFE